MQVVTTVKLLNGDKIEVYTFGSQLHARLISGSEIEIAITKEDTIFDKSHVNSLRQKQLVADFIARHNKKVVLHSQVASLW